MTTRRTGAVLAELVVALMIAGAAAVIGISLLVTAERRTRADATADRTTQAARDVARILTAEIEAALPESVAVRGDTALDLQSHIAASVACVVSGSVVVLPGAATSAGLPFTYVRQLPETGDLLLAWDSTNAGYWFAAAVDSVSPRPNGGGCATTSGYRTLADSLAPIATTRLRLNRTLPATVSAGAPVRLYRGARWFLHRSSDKTWALGYRRCANASCSSAQPVAGPLASFADTGLSFAVLSPGVITISVKSVSAPVRSKFSVAIRSAPDGPPNAPP